MTSIDLSTHRLHSMYDVAVKSTPLKQPSPPFELISFRKKTEEDGFKQIPTWEQNKKKSEFCKRERVSEYLENKWKVEIYNRDMFILIFNQLKENENPERTKILISKLNTFKSVIKGYQKPFEALLVDFNKYDIPFLGIN